MPYRSRINIDSNPRSAGLGFTTVLFLVFLVLKLTHTISWSWLWVTSPIWIHSLIVSLTYVLFLILCHIDKD